MSHPANWYNLLEGPMDFDPDEVFFGKKRNWKWLWWIAFIIVTAWVWMELLSDEMFY